MYNVHTVYRIFFFPIPSRDCVANSNILRSYPKIRIRLINRSDPDPNK